MPPAVTRPVGTHNFPCPTWGVGVKLDPSGRNADSARLGGRPKKAMGGGLRSLRGQWTDRLCSHVVCSEPSPSGLVVSSGESQMSHPETRSGWGQEWLCLGRLSHVLACPLQFICVPRLCLFLPE